MAEEENKPRLPFRQQALEYIATPKPLDDLIQINPLLTWLLTAALGLIAVAIILWLIFGVMETTIPGRGVVLTEHEAVVYVSALKIDRVANGIPVEILPLDSRYWIYHQILGEVTEIDQKVTSPEQMLKELNNPSLSNYFLQRGPVFSIKIHLDNLASPYYSLMPGSLIQAQIIVRRQTPLSLIFSR